MRRYYANVLQSEVIDLDRYPNVIYRFTHDWLPENEEFADLYQDARLTRTVWEFFDDSLGEAFVTYLEELGYKAARFEDSVPDDEGNFIEGMTTVVFDPSDIIPIHDGQDDLFLRHEPETRT